MSTICFGYLPADFDRDGIVDFYDFATFSGLWLREDPNVSGINLTDVDPNFLATVVGPHHQIYPCRYIPIYIDPMDDEDKWSVNVSFNHTLTLDETNYKTARDSNNSAFSISRSSDAGLDFLQLYSNRTASPLDLRDDDGNAPYCVVRFYFPTAQDGPNMADFCVKLRSGGNWDNYYTFYFNGLWKSQGWHTQVKAPSDWSEVGTLDWSAVDFIRFDMQIADGSTPTVVIDSIAFLKKPYNKAKLAITFDDNNESLYPMAAFMSAKGIRTTFYCVSTWVEGGSMLTVEHLQQMQEMGHLIANHSWSHKFFKTNGLTKEEFRDEIQKCSVWMHKNGFSKGARIYAVPGGTGQINYSSGIDIETDIFPYVDSVRLTGNMGTRLLLDPRLAYTSYCTDTNFAEMESRLAKAVADKGIMVVLFHNPNEADFKAFIDDGAAGCVMDYVRAGTLECVTMDELLDMRE